MKSIAEQLREFNKWRQKQFGRWPTPDDPLPMSPIGRGGDPIPQETEQNFKSNG